MYNFKHDDRTFKLHIQNQSYIVDPEARTITVDADVYVEMPEFITRTINPLQLPNGYTTDTGLGAIHMSHTARCSEEDTWDEEKGKKIAMAALEAKAYFSMGKRIRKWRESFQGFVTDINIHTADFLDKCTNEAIHDLEYIDSITG